MSVATKFDTVSLKVILTVNAPFWTVVGTSVISTVGGTSTVTVWLSEAELFLSASSVAITAFASTAIITVPSLVGVIVAVYIDASVPCVKSVTVAVAVPVNEISSVAKPVTFSLKVIVTVNAAFWTVVGTLLIVTVTSSSCATTVPSQQQETMKMVKSV